VRATPSAVVVRPDGTVGSRLAEGGDAIHAMVEQLSNRDRNPVVAWSPPRRVVLARGEAAPALRLLDADNLIVGSEPVSRPARSAIVLEPGLWLLRIHARRPAGVGCESDA
jgi:hypothetical protein